jgi:hypothetical protein
MRKKDAICFLYLFVVVDYLAEELFSRQLGFNHHQKLPSLRLLFPQEYIR